MRPDGLLVRKETQFMIDTCRRKRSAQEIELIRECMFTYIYIYFNSKKKKFHVYCRSCRLHYLFGFASKTRDSYHKHYLLSSLSLSACKGSEPWSNCHYSLRERTVNDKLSKAEAINQTMFTKDSNAICVNIVDRDSRRATITKTTLVRAL
jgi:hypothetical protein